jgi:membrane protein implicated in regulation of membrane protease activity
MSRVDWPLAILLVVVFVVMSVLRWRYFMSASRRRTAKKDDGKTEDSRTG